MSSRNASLLVLFLTLPWLAVPGTLWGVPLWALTSIGMSILYALLVAFALIQALPDEPPGTDSGSAKRGGQTEHPGPAPTAGRSADRPAGAP